MGMWNRTGERLRGQASGAYDAARSYSSDAADAASDYLDTAYERGRQASRQLQGTGGEVWSRAGEMAGDVVEASEAARRYATREIREYPLTTVLVSFGLGVIAGVLLNTRSS